MVRTATESALLDDDSQSIDIVSPLPRIDTCTLAERAFPDGRALCTEHFLYASRDQYGLPWLTREIVQNFVDGNSNAPGTLDGVEISEESIEGGATRITICGNWPFPSYNGLLNFHSDKTEAGVAEFAGGNGIGIKQTVLRFLRDLNVDRFDIVGEGWKVSYKMMSSDKINYALKAKHSEGTVESGVLMAFLTSNDSKGTCRYVIETADREVVAALRDMDKLGVSGNNPYLKDPAFSNQHGVLKWIPIPEETVRRANAKPRLYNDDLPVQTGRLFLNGQVMKHDDYSFSDRHPENPWGGPSGLTMALHNKRYRITLDRPSMGAYDFYALCDDFLASIPSSDLVGLLLSSTSLWPLLRDDGIKALPLYVIEDLVKRLVSMGFDQKAYAQAFGDQKFLCADQSLTREQRKKFADDGYLLCPQIFGLIHMPLASHLLSDFDRVTALRPDASRAAKVIFEASETVGVPIPYMPLKTPTNQIRTVASDFKSKVGTKCLDAVEVSKDHPHTLTLKIIDTIRPHDLVSSNPALHSKSMMPIRSLIAHGLKSRWLSSAFLCQGDYISTFSFPAYTDDLLILNTKYHTEGVALNLSFMDDAMLQEFLSGLQQEITPDHSSKKMSPKTVMGITALAVAAVVGSVMEGDSTLVLGGTAVGAVIWGTSRAIRAIRALPPIPSEPKHSQKSRPASSQKIHDWYMKQSSNTKPDNTSRLERIHDRFTRANVPKSLARAQDSERLAHLLAQHGFFTESESDIEDFEIIETTPRQQAQWDVMNDYFAVTTDYEIPNLFFVFRGRGVHGLNTGACIGLHEALFDSSFEEAVVMTLRHEIVHNSIRNHGDAFISFYSALSAHAESRLIEIALKSHSERTEPEQSALEARMEWDRLRGA